MMQLLREWYKKHVMSRYLPCTVFNRDPLVLVSYDRDFIRNAAAFLDAFSESSAKTVHVFLQLGWEHETPKNSETFVQQIEDIQRAKKLLEAAKG